MAAFVRKYLNKCAFFGCKIKKIMLKYNVLLIKEVRIMITHDELKLLCDLSRLYISEDELESYGKEMTDIIELMDTIGESDFEYEMKDMSNAVPFSSLRDDMVTEFDNMDGIVENGPEVIEHRFVVPKVVD